MNGLLSHDVVSGKMRWEPCGERRLSKKPKVSELDSLRNLKNRVR